MEEKNGMPEYLVLLKLNPTKIMEAMNAIRKMDDKPVAGVDLRYSMNIFGAWDVGVWIDAGDSPQAMEFVQKKMKNLNGVTEVYAIPTFPHGNGSESGAKDSQASE